MVFPDSPLGSPFESDFPLWDPSEPPILFPRDEELAGFTTQSFKEPLSSNSGSDEPPDRTDPKTPAPGPNIDERKRRRMISNRLSARRSRMRKQKHLEKLRNLFGRFRFENLERSTRVRFLAYQNQMIRGENEHLRLEAAALRRRLRDIRQEVGVLQLQQQLNSSSLILPFNNFASVNGARQFKQHSLIT